MVAGRIPATHQLRRNTGIVDGSQKGGMGIQADKTRILDSQPTAQVVHCIQARIEDESLKPGDNIPSEHEFAKMLKISRPNLRMGPAYPVTTGVVNVRDRDGVFVADGPEAIATSTLHLLGDPNRYKAWQMFEVRKLLETTLAGLAAERGTQENFTVLAEEIVNMYASIGNPVQYLIHDMNFHRAIAQAAGNPILLALIEAISTRTCDEQRKPANRVRDRKTSIDEHRAIYRAIRAGDPVKARTAMECHLRCAERERVIASRWTQRGLNLAQPL